MKKVGRTILWILLVPVLAALALIFTCDGIISHAAKGRCYESTEAIPHNKAALVLGTSSKLAGGRPNAYFTNRIRAAVELFNAGKVDCIVVSGDNRHASYNEPREMKRALLAAGIPESKIFMDYAGFRTLDSVVRMDTIFSQNSFTVVSQRFHIERALYIARSRGLDAIGYTAGDVNRFYGFKTRCREYLARVKMFLDLLTHKEPHFGGEKIDLITDD